MSRRPKVVTLIAASPERPASGPQDGNAPARPPSSDLGYEALDRAFSSVGPFPRDVSRLDQRGEIAAQSSPDVRSAPTSGIVPGQFSEDRAEQPPAEISLKNAQNKVDLTLPDKMTLTQLLDLTGEYLGFNVVYEPNKIPDDTISLKLHGKYQGQLQVRDLYTLLKTVLAFKGLAMVQKDPQLVAVVPDKEALAADPRWIENNTGIVPPGDMVVLRVFQLQYADVSSVKDLLESLKLGISISAIARTQTLLVTCYTHRLKRIEQLIGLIDQPGKSRFFRFRPLNYTIAETVAQQVQVLAQELQDLTVITSDVTSSEKQRSGPLVLTQPKSKTPAQPPAPKPSVFLTTDKRTNRLIMIGYQDQLHLINQLIDALDVPPSEPRFFHVYPIRHTDAQETFRKLTDLMRSVHSGTGIDARQSAGPTGGLSHTAQDNVSGPLLIDLKNAHAILAYANRAQQAEIARILGLMDVAARDLRCLKAYHLEHVEASEAQRKLVELGLYNTSSDGNQPAPTKASVDLTIRAAGVQVPRMVVVETSNALLIYASENQQRRIQAVLDYMDTRPQDQAIPYELYPLENQTPDHVAEILTKIIQETLTHPESKTGKVPSHPEDRIVFVPDEQTFSLIVYANRKNQTWIGKLVKRLDRRRPQVLIDVTLVEIRKTDEFNYDLNLVGSLPNLTETGGQTGSFTVNGQTVMDRLLASGRDRTLDLQSQSGSATGFYADRKINALLSVMQAKNYGRVLAKPKILVNDNETGTIKTTDTTYVTKKSSIPVSTGSAGQQSNLVETAIDYQGYDAGITLKISPHVGEGDLLRLDIALSRSDFGTITGDVPPDRTDSDLNTVVTVPDASTIILGGMLKLNQSKGGQKVPILGDIPLIGLLFRGIANKDIQNKLYVFVRAEIIRPEETLEASANALKRISNQNRAAFEEHEKEFQTYQSIPGIKPNPTSPVKVLEAQ